MMVAIVQARMASSRLPGKIMREILGRPMVSFCIERLRACRPVDEVALATTTHAGDDGVAQFAAQAGLRCYRGSEHDVLDRYCQAARSFGAEDIMRVSSDCPLVDPQVCERLVRTYRESGADYVRTGPTFAEGLDCEVFSLRAIEGAWREARLPSEREHVTVYFKNHRDRFKIITMVNETDDGKYRFSVDEPADFEVVKAIFEALYREGQEPFGAEAIKHFLDTHPDIFGRNRHIIRNEGLLRSLKKDKPL
jgi:spore coat polysaccharide biosynthesis protein SpsF (cytidylyltransferase family)